METLALTIVSLALALPVIGMAWIYRHHKRLNSLNGLFAFIIVAFTTWHYFSYAPVPGGEIHEIITSIFVLVTSAMNVYCSTSPHIKINVGINRRTCYKAGSAPVPKVERRQLAKG